MKLLKSWWVLVNRWDEIMYKHVNQFRRNRKVSYEISDKIEERDNSDKQMADKV